MSGFERHKAAEHDGAEHKKKDDAAPITAGLSNSDAAARAHKARARRGASAKKEASPGSGGAADENVQGGPVTLNGLHRDLMHFNDRWKASVKTGINQFVHGALEARINDISSGDWSSFITTLVGGTIWSAAAFAPEGAMVAAFAISMAGMSTQAVTAAPKPKNKDTSITTVENMLLNQLDYRHSQINGQLAGAAQGLLKTYPEAGRYRLLGEFLVSNFKSGMYTIVADSQGMPSLNEKAIRVKAKLGAADLLQRWKAEVQPIGKEEYTPLPTDGNVSSSITTKGKLAHIGDRNDEASDRLALVEEMTTSTFAAFYSNIRTRYKFKRWISRDLEKSATNQSYGANQDLLHLYPDQVDGMP